MPSVSSGLDALDGTLADPVASRNAVTCGVADHPMTLAYGWSHWYFQRCFP